MASKLAKFTSLKTLLNTSHKFNPFIFSSPSIGFFKLTLKQLII